MPRLYEIAWLLILCGCGNTTVCEYSTTRDNFSTPQGVDVRPRDNEIDPIQVDAAFTVVTGMFKDRYPNEFTDEVLRRYYLTYQLSVTFYDDMVPCDAEEDICYGVTNGATWIEVYNDSPCIGLTSLAHEIVHVMGESIAGDGDHNHANPEYFEESGGIDSIEYQAESYLTSNYCYCGENI